MIGPCNSLGIPLLEYSNIMITRSAMLHIYVNIAKTEVNIVGFAKKQKYLNIL